jgi:hypothetical protein
MEAFSDGETGRKLKELISQAPLQLHTNQP